MWSWYRINYIQVGRKTRPKPMVKPSEPSDGNTFATSMIRIMRNFMTYKSILWRKIIWPKTPDTGPCLINSVRNRRKRWSGMWGKG
jgi:hypothetical protein